MTQQVATSGGMGTITIRFKASFSFEEQTKELRMKAHLPAIMDFITKVVKNSLTDQKYKQIGRLPKFYNTKDKKSIEEYQLDMWPGYTCQVKCLNDGFFLNVDTATKFLQKSTVADKIK